MRLTQRAAVVAAAIAVLAPAAGTVAPAASASAAENTIRAPTVVTADVLSTETYVDNEFE
jgi:hypothetical protein